MLHKWFKQLKYKRLERLLDAEYEADDNDIIGDYLSESDWMKEKANIMKLNMD